MLSKNNGFSVVEVLVSASVILMLMTTIIPVTSLLEKERTVLGDRRIFVNRLHDELQPFLWSDLSFPATYLILINQTDVTFNFTRKENYVKGCATWENARKKRETFCLYGYK